MVSCFKFLVVGLAVLTYSQAGLGETAASTPVDAVTSGSVKIKVATTGTSATLTCTDQYTNGTRTLVYGTSSSYGTNLSPAFQTYRKSSKYTVTISKLTQNTTYYFKITGSFNGTNTSKTATWKTQAETSARESNPKDNKSLVLSFGKTQFVLPVNFNQVVHLSLYSLNGAKIMSKNIQPENQSGMVAMREINAGIYLLKVNCGHIKLAQKVVVGN